MNEDLKKLVADQFQTLVPTFTDFFSKLLTDALALLPQCHQRYELQGVQEVESFSELLDMGRVLIHPIGARVPLKEFFAVHTKTFAEFFHLLKDHFLLPQNPTQIQRDLLVSKAFNLIKISRSKPLSVPDDELDLAYAKSLQLLNSDPQKKPYLPINTSEEKTYCVTIANSLIDAFTYPRLDPKTKADIAVITERLHTVNADPGPYKRRRIMEITNTMQSRSANGETSLNMSSAYESEKKKLQALNEQVAELQKPKVPTEGEIYTESIMNQDFNDTSFDKILA